MQAKHNWLAMLLCTILTGMPLSSYFTPPYFTIIWGKKILFCTPLTDLTRIHGYHSPSVPEHVSHEAAYAHTSPEAATGISGTRASPIPSVGASAAEVLRN